MKICLINNLYEPFGRGGADEVTKNIATGLASAGHDVFVVTVGREIKKEENTYYVKPLNVFSYLDINTKPALVRLVWWFFNIFNFSGRNQIKKILETEKPEVVLTHNLVGIPFLLPRLIKKLGIGHIHTLHDIQLVYPSGQLIWGEEKNFINTFFLRVWYEKLTRRLFGSPDIVISPSKWLLEFYVQRGFFKNSRKEVIANPINACHPELGSGSNEILKQVQYDKKINFLFVGTVERYKGVLFLIETLKNIAGDFVLKIVGDGRDLAKAKELAAGDNRFEFLVRKNKIELTEIYKSSDCLILPTLTYENLPTVILEAFSFGVPVLASNIGGIPELVEENKTGWLFEPGNSEELKRKIETLLSKPEETAKLREICLEKAKEFKIENYIDKLTKLI